jgi:excisionase family DNA binding protein
MAHMEREPVRDIMTPEQVAAYLQLHPETVYRLIRRRELAASRIGRAYRIPRADVESYLVTHSTRPQVRKLLFDRALGYAERHNPAGDSGAILEELEQRDEERKHRRATP